jgi:hypothetical protein
LDLRGLSPSVRLSLFMVDALFEAFLATRFALEVFTNSAGTSL